MRKHSLLTFTCYGAAVVLSCLPGILTTPVNIARDEHSLSTSEESPHNAPAKRAIALTGACSGDWAAAVDWAKDEALDMINFVVPRFQTLLAHMNSNPVPSTVSMNIADRTVFQTYEAFFGQMYFDEKTVAARNKNAASIARLQGLIGTAQLIQRALQNPGAYNTEIWCHDGFLWPTGNPRTQYDGRRWTQANRVYDQVSLTTCDQSPGTRAYTYQPNSPPFLGETVIVLCGAHLPAWTQRYLNNDNVNLFHNNRPLLTNRYPVDHLWGYLPATLIHEFTHAQNIMGRASLADQCLMDQTPAYQWQAIRRLAQQDPNKAAANSDSFSLFVTAIYLNKNDWSTGVGQSLGFVPLGRRSGDNSDQDDEASSTPVGVHLGPAPARTVSRRVPPAAGPSKTVAKPRKMRGDNPKDLAAKARKFSTQNLAAFQKVVKGGPSKPPNAPGGPTKPPTSRPPVPKPPTTPGGSTKPPISRPTVPNPPTNPGGSSKPPGSRPTVPKPPTTPGSSIRPPARRPSSPKRLFG